MSLKYCLDRENKGKENETILQSQRNEKMVMPFFKTIKFRQLLNPAFCLCGYKLCIHHLWLSSCVPTFSWISPNFMDHFFSYSPFIPPSTCSKKVSSLKPLPWNPNSISSLQREFLCVKFEMTAYVSNTQLPPPSFLYLRKWQFHPSDQNPWSHLNSSFLY